jgi:hypothetical protein
MICEAEQQFIAAKMLDADFRGEAGELPQTLRQKPPLARLWQLP